MEHIRTVYQAAIWKDGKRTGSIMDFSTWKEAEDHLGDPMPHWPRTPVIKVPWNQRIPADATGWVIEEIRLKCVPGGPLNGIRIFA